MHVASALHIYLAQAMENSGKLKPA